MQGLAFALGALLERRVYIVWEVSHEHVGDARIVQAGEWVCNICRDRHDVESVPETVRANGGVERDVVVEPTGVSCALAA